MASRYLIITFMCLFLFEISFASEGECITQKHWNTIKYYCTGFTQIPENLNSTISYLYLDRKNYLPNLLEEEFTLANLTHLVTIELSSCKIQGIDIDAFVDMSLLKVLNLNGNELQVFNAETLNHTTQLETLNLSNNKKLQQLNRQFPPLMNLKSIYLENCKIAAINVNTFRNLENLNTLDLRGNRLQTLNSNFVSTPLLSLHLQGNPLVCDCDLKGVIILYISQNFRSDKELIHCEQPKSLAEVGWLSSKFDIDEISCTTEPPDKQKSSTWLWVLLTLMLIALIGGLSLAGYYFTQRGKLRIIKVGGKDIDFQADRKSNAYTMDPTTNVEIRDAVENPLLEEMRKPEIVTSNSSHVPDSEVVEIDCYEILNKNLTLDKRNTLGAGCFGVVLKGVLRSINPTIKPLEVAVKMNRNKTDWLALDGLRAELEMMIQIGKHRNIVNLIGAVLENYTIGEMLIVVELCSKGSLLSYVKSKRSTFVNLVTNDNLIVEVSNESMDEFTTMDLIKWSWEIANGMAFLGSKKIIHGDLAARNVLLSSDGTAKLSDFGLSRELLDDYYTKTSEDLLPWAWMSYESLTDNKYSVKSDAWAYGVTLWEIFTLGEKPWAGKRPNDKFLKLLKKGERLQKPQYSANEVHLLSMKCWGLQSNRRPTFESMMKVLESLNQGLCHMKDTIDDDDYFQYLKKKEIQVEVSKIYNEMKPAESPENLDDVEIPLLEAILSVTQHDDQCMSTPSPEKLSEL